MNRFLATTAAALLGTAAIAQTGEFIEFEAVDIDDDGFVSEAEIQTVWPEFETVFFNDMDANDDNRLSVVEYNAVETQDVLGRYASNVIVEGENATAIAATDVQPGVPVEREVDRIIADIADLETVLDRETIDTDASGFIEFAEILPYYPGLEQVDYDDMDQNDDNRLDFTELYSLESVDILNR